MDKSVESEICYCTLTQMLETSDKVQGLAVYSILKNKVDMKWLYSEMVDQQVAPLTHSLFGAMKHSHPYIVCDMGL